MEDRVKAYDLFFSGLENDLEKLNAEQKSPNTGSGKTSVTGRVSSSQELQGEGGVSRTRAPLLERLLRISRTRGESLIQIPDSIVIVRPPRGVFLRMVLVNSFFRRVPAYLLRKQIDQNTVLEVRKRCREIAERAWESLASVYPFAYANSLQNWRYFNDSYDEKKLLVMQKEHEAYVVIPVVDEMGMLFMALKHMCVVRRRLRQTMDVGIVDVLSRTRDDLIKELDSVLNSVKNSRSSAGSLLKS